MSGAKIDRENIYRLLKRHHRPLSARRIMSFAQEEFGFDGNYGLLLSTLKAWAVPNRLKINSEQKQVGEGQDDLIEVRHGIFTLRSCLSKKTKPKNVVHNKLKSPEQSTPSQVHSSPSLEQPQRSRLPSSLLIAHDGKSSIRGELTPESLSEAERISGFLYPYPVAPVLVSDVINAQKELGDQFSQALWQQLQSESTHIAQTLSLKLKVPLEKAYSSKISPLPTNIVIASQEENLDSEHNSTKGDNGHYAALETGQSPIDEQEESSHDYTEENIDIQVQAILKDSLTWITMTELLKQLDSTKMFENLNESQKVQRLSTHLKSANHQAQSLGQRPPYLFSLNGEAMCSAQGQNSRLLELEAEIDQLLSEYNNELLKHLESKLQQMSLASFESLLMAYLERDQYTQLEALNRRDGRLALLAQHPRGTTLVIAQQSRKALSQQQLEQISRSLKSMYVESCIVIHLGGFDIQSSSNDSFTLINATQFARLLINKNIGVHKYNMSRSFIDETWFDDQKTKV